MIGVKVRCMDRTLTRIHRDRHDPLLAVPPRHLPRDDHVRLPRPIRQPHPTHNQKTTHQLTLRIQPLRRVPPPPLTLAHRAKVDLPVQRGGRGCRDHARVPVRGALRPREERGREQLREEEVAWQGEGEWRVSRRDGGEGGRELPMTLVPNCMSKPSEVIWSMGGAMTPLEGGMSAWTCQFSGDVWAYALLNSRCNSGSVL